MNTNISKLPEQAFVILDTTGEMVMVKRGVKGYFPQRQENIPWDAKNMDILNERMGVTKAQSEAMKAGSMFGFDKPIANPDNYDDNGYWIG